MASKGKTMRIGGPDKVRRVKRKVGKADLRSVYDNMGAGRSNSDQSAKANRTFGVSKTPNKAQKALTRKARRQVGG